MKCSTHTKSEDHCATEIYPRAGNDASVAVVQSGFVVAVVLFILATRNQTECDSSPFVENLEFPRSLLTA